MNFGLLAILLNATLSSLPPPAKPIVLAPPPSPAPMRRLLRDKWFPYFTIRAENDSLPGAGGDDSYTQGLEFRFSREDFLSAVPGVTRLLDLAWNEVEGDNAEVSDQVVIGQTIVTPHNIITYRPNPLDRPFGAFLYAGVEQVRLREPDLRASDKQSLPGQRVAVSYLVGTTGRPAGGRFLQSGFHILRENRMAKGWLESQLAFRPQFQVGIRRDHTGPHKNDNADLTFTEEVTVGTLQAYGGLGVTGRIGRGLTRIPGGVIAHSFAGGTSPPNRFEISLQGGVRLRAVAHNAFITGDDGLDRHLRKSNVVWDLNLGVEVRWKAWRGSYTVVQRSREFTPVPAGLPAHHRFVAIALSRQMWSESEAVKPCGTWIKEGLRLNLRFGLGASQVSPHYPAAHTPSLAASVGPELRLLSRSVGTLSIAYEQTGVAREGGPPAPGIASHEDLFLTARTGSLGFQFEFGDHAIQSRIGLGRGTAKHQVTEDLGAIKEPEPDDAIGTGLAVLAGIRYGFRFTGPLSFVADLAVARVSTNRAVLDHGTITTATFGIQIHPWRKRK